MNEPGVLALIINLTERPDIAGSPSPAHAYLGVARSLRGGFEILAAAGVGPATYAHAMIAGHMTEVLLKGYISAALPSLEIKKGHNLVAAWDSAVQSGLEVLGTTPPAWLTQLNLLHDRPHVLRYSVGVNAMVSPAMQELTEGVLSLMAKIDPFIAGGPYAG